MFVVVMVVSVLFTLSATDLFSVWFGLEVGVFSFLGYLGCGNSYRCEGGEAVFKYAISQAFGSIGVLLGALAFYLGSDGFSTGLGCVGMLVNLGVPPFHVWYPSVVVGMDWREILVLSTVQNVGPLGILSAMDAGHLVLSVIAGVGVLVSGVGGINQVSTRGVVAYSSIGHVCWGILAGCVGFVELGLYLFVYFVSMYFLCNYFLYLGLFRIYVMTGGPPVDFGEWVGLCVVLLSMAGLPPLLGFVPKWLVVLGAVDKFPVGLSFALVGSVFSLWYYLGLIFFVLAHSFVPGVRRFEGSGLSWAFTPRSKYWVVICFCLHVFGGVFLMIYCVYFLM